MGSRPPTKNKKTARPRSITRVFLRASAALAVLLAVTLAAFSAYVLWQTRQLQEATEQALFEGIQAELSAGYQELARLLQDRQAQIREAHEAALELVGETPPERIDIDKLQQRIAELTSLPTDVYIVGPDHVVQRSTYAPDRGLDFKHPALLDALSMVERALEQQEVVVGPPVVELLARSFRLYSYSPLGDQGHVLELGFVPPDLNGYFFEIEERIAERSLYNARLHFLMWDDWLLSLDPEQRLGANKNDAIAEQYRLRAELAALFREARDLGHPLRALDPRDGKPRYYLHVMDIPGDDNNFIKVMAEVEMRTGTVDATRHGLIGVSAATLLILLGGVLLLMRLLRLAIAQPLQEAARSMEASRPMRLSPRAREIRELQLLASHYNSLLDSTRSKIHGLSREARTDSLTGLPNRVQLEHELEREIERARQQGVTFSLVIVDLDHFKLINDRHGHLQGDDMLRCAARALAGNTRASDTVGRWGGEEFVLILRGAPLDEATTLCEKLRQALAAARSRNGHQCTASFGVAACAAEDTAAELFRRADQALYRAKAEGRDRVEQQA